MATSDSDDFESADEEIELRHVTPRKSSSSKWQPNSTIGSDSDDDNVCISTVKGTSWSDEISDKKCKNSTAVSSMSNDNTNQLPAVVTEQAKESKVNVAENVEMDKTKSQPTKRPQRQQKPKVVKAKSFGAKKLDTQQREAEIVQASTATAATTSESLVPEVTKGKVLKEKSKPAIREECWEFDDDEATMILQRESLESRENTWRKMSNKSSDMTELDNEEVPEELKSNKKFKEVFNNDGWEGLDDDGDRILAELDNDGEEVKPILDKLAAAATTPVSDDNTDASWGSWGSWGVTSLLNTASAGVSTLTNSVSQGLSLLEESIATPNSIESAESKLDEKNDTTQDNQSMSSFGFSNIMSGVSSITKLVESTGTKVIHGGLGTLETIGKKTMQVLQEGDPGLKKKRAFFTNQVDKPILSKILREAKEKAESAEKTVEEKQQARKVHFETLFDDYQGLVHLEALEMLSKQSNIKIQQKLVSLDTDEMISIQETLDEVKELCDLGEEDDDDEENCSDNLQEKLNNACTDLGVTISYDKLYQLWEETKIYIANCSQAESTEVTDNEIFQNAISTLARFTAYCVETFHKTAELVLIKERRSTVNEADALVQLTKVLSGQIGLVASLFSQCLNERSKKTKESTVDITTIFLEATNASSYIQDAFRLLIPILQVGAI